MVVATILSRTCGDLCNFRDDARCIRETWHQAAQLWQDTITCSTKPVSTGEFPCWSPSPTSPRRLRAPPANL